MTVFQHEIRNAVEFITNCYHVFTFQPPCIRFLCVCSLCHHRIDSHIVCKSFSGLFSRKFRIKYFQNIFARLLQQAVMKVSESTFLMITTKKHFYLPVTKLESHSKTGQILRFTNLNHKPFLLTVFWLKPSLQQLWPG